MQDFKIPVDKMKSEFIRHLNANPRTILSSKFGEGKSYFINELKHDSKINEGYTFLTLYPVNYQVAENADIFEYIKRDILFQLMYNNMISEEIELTDVECIEWFIRTNGANFIGDLIPYIASLGLLPEQASVILPLLKSLPLFKKLISTYNSFKRRYKNPQKDAIDKFLNEVENNSRFEPDTITSIIQQSIRDYKERTNKNVVLFIEDLDRIDPAHLFRILNILSAHIDCCYKEEVQPDVSLSANKFGLDNIILVIDKEILKNIYIHFYGKSSNFEGYISKFLSNVPFDYSLTEIRENYIIGELEKIMGFTSTIYPWMEEMVKTLFPPETYKDDSLRKIIQALEIEKEIPTKPIIHLKDRDIELDIKFLNAIAVLKRIGESEETIAQRLEKIIVVNDEFFLDLIGPYLFLFYDYNKDKNKLGYKLANMNIHLHLLKDIIEIQFYILNNRDDFRFQHDHPSYSDSIDTEISLVDLVHEMMKWIV